ncbi:MAG: hypothetical protein AAGG99_07220, partial [Pseudomonadota bacterium]
VVTQNGRVFDLMDRRRMRVDSGETVTFRMPRAARLDRVSIDARATRNGRRTAQLRVAGRTVEQASNARQFEELELGEVQPGERAVQFNVGGDEGRFSRLRIRSLDARVRVGSVTVTYGNGRSERFDLNQRLRPGEETAAMELAGRNPRNVRRVVAELRVRGDARNQRLVLLGRERAARQRPPSRDPVASLVQIGDRVSDTRDERIAIPVDANFDYDTIRIRTRDSSLNVRSVTFERTRGGSDTVRYRDNINAGDVSEAIRVPEGRGRVDLVVLRVRPTNRRGTVRVAIVAERQRRRARDIGSVPRDRIRPAPRLVGEGNDYGRFQRAARQRLTDRRRQYAIDFRADQRGYDAVAFRVTRGNARIRFLDITYGNGKTDRLPINTRFDRNTTSNVYLMTGPRRKVNQIAFEARTTNDSRRDAIVEVFVRRAPEPRTPVRTGRRFEREGDWILLGRQRAEMFSRDSDTFKVGRDYGRFDAIRVRAKRTDVRLYGMTITFGNGRTEDVPVYGELQRGRTTDAVELRARGRFIENVALNYRSRLSLRGEGRVEVWGRVAERGQQREVRDTGPRDTGRRLLRDILRDFESKFRN